MLHRAPKENAQRDNASARGFKAIYDHFTPNWMRPPSVGIYGYLARSVAKTDKPRNGSSPRELPLVANNVRASGAAPTAKASWESQFDEFEFVRADGARGYEEWKVEKGLPSRYRIALRVEK